MFKNTVDSMDSRFDGRRALEMNFIRVYKGEGVKQGEGNNGAGIMGGGDSQKSLQSPGLLVHLASIFHG